MAYIGARLMDKYYYYYIIIIIIIILFIIIIIIIIILLLLLLLLLLSPSDTVVKAFAHGAMGRRIDPLWWTHWAISRYVVCAILSVGWCI